jgi:esterase/lipase
METVKLQVLELKKLSAKSSEKNQKMLLDLPASYWLDLNQNPALKDFKKLRKPTLVLHAGRDYQINETDLNVIKVASKNRKNLEISVFKDLNHLFLSGKGPSKPEEYMEPGHVPTEVGDSISRWIQNQEGSLVK